MPIKCIKCQNDVRDNSKFCPKCGAKFLRNGRYQDLVFIAQGGMGKIYKAIDTSFDNYVAVKEMLVSNPQDKQFAIAQFEQEAKILRNLKHLSIPSVVDFFSESQGNQQGDTYYFVMDFVEGKTLENILKNDPSRLNGEQVVKWAIQICDVLSYLHSQNPPIIFKDLNPRNVMIDNNGTVKLIDFGIARMFKSSKTCDTVYLGTEGYASPEHYGMRGQTDACSDIYTLGMTMYQLLTRLSEDKLPHATSRLAEFAQKRSDLIVAPFIPKGIFKLNIEREIESIILKSVALTPDARFQSANEMKLALESAITKKLPQQNIQQQIIHPQITQQQPTIKNLPKPTQTPIKTINTGKNLKNIIILAAIFIIGLILFWLWSEGYIG